MAHKAETAVQGWSVDPMEDVILTHTHTHTHTCSVSTSSSVCTIAPLGTLSSHRTFSLYVHSPANISRCLSLFSSFLFWSSQGTFQEARLRDPKHYIGDEDSDNFFFLVVVGTSWIMAFRLGSIEPFDAGTGDWSTYKARLEQFLVANDVEGEPKQVATVLTLIGGPTYGLLVNLLAPEEPAKQKLADIFATLDGHFAPKPLVIAERYRFNKRDQRPGEPLNDYVAELRRLARHCEFGSNLNEHLRDRLVCGLNNPATIRKLLAEANLDLKKAIHIAHATETAARDANELHKETPVPTHQLRAQSAKFKGRYQTHGHGSKPCYRCGGTDHRQEDCPHKNSTCDYCRKTGHIDAACRKKRADQPDSTAPSSRSTQTKPTSRHTPRSAARAHNLEAEDYSEDEFFIHHNEQDTEHKRTEIWIEPSINGRSLKMELDTGSALSIIPLRLYSAHFTDLELSPSSVVLKTYTGERVRPTGALDVTVECNEQKVQAQLLVVDTCGPPLFGRDWLKLIRIDWPRVFRVEKVKREEEPPIKQAENLTPATKVKLEALLDKYADIFGEDRGKLRTGKGHLQLRDDAVPKFCKARPLPYALRSKVAEELSRLESDGIISPVSWSDWATPIVPIVKKDGSVRVCGDFKVTVNPQLNVEQYPLPRIDDVFASLAGGKRFSKIDLKQAYLQMEMDDESSALLTLNTHKGLFKLNRLAFGVASAPALWQRSMDQILQGIPYTQCILDDIIVTGEDDAEHLRNLETVFRRLSEAGLRVNRLKCNFFQEHVEYCGHGVSARGLHKTPAKIDAISDARCPVNVTELRSFLGLVNYYARFLPNLATTLHPLNELLQKGVEWRWTADCTTAFDTVKAQIASDLVLTHFDSALPVRVASDASPYGLGAVLSHVMPTGEERPDRVCISDTVSRRKELQSDRQRGTWNRLEHQEVPHLPLWSSVHADHRPSAAYSDFSSGETFTGDDGSQTTTIRTFSGWLSLQHRVSQDYRPRQCWWPVTSAAWQPRRTHRQRCRRRGISCFAVRRAARYRWPSSSSNTTGPDVGCCLQRGAVWWLFGLCVTPVVHLSAQRAHDASRLCVVGCSCCCANQAASSSVARAAWNALRSCANEGASPKLRMVATDRCRHWKHCFCMHPVSGEPTSTGEGTASSLGMAGTAMATSPYRLCWRISFEDVADRCRCLQ